MKFEPQEVAEALRFVSALRLAGVHPDIMANIAANSKETHRIAEFLKTDVTVKTRKPSLDVSLKVPLTEWGLLTARTSNPMLRESISTLGALAFRTKYDILAYRGVGLKILEELEATLFEYGLSFREDGETYMNKAMRLSHSMQDRGNLPVDAVLGDVMSNFYIWALKRGSGILTVGQLAGLGRMGIAQIQYRPNGEAEEMQSIPEIWSNHIVDSLAWLDIDVPK